MIWKYFSKIIRQANKKIETNTKVEISDMTKFLIVGLGNIGMEYKDTRHNIGFKIIEEIAKVQEVTFESKKLGSISCFNYKGKEITLLKPSTYMNLSGKSVRYWMLQKKINIDHILIITDDIHLDFGTIRIKPKGSAGGHNGLKDIEQKLGSNQYARFRFGVGADFGKGRQVDYVLGKWSKQENSELIERTTTCNEAVLSFVHAGISNTMNQFNGK